MISQHLELHVALICEVCGGKAKEISNKSTNEIQTTPTARGGFGTIHDSVKHQRTVIMTCHQLTLYGRLQG